MPTLTVELSDQQYSFLIARSEETGRNPQELIRSWIMDPLRPEEINPHLRESGVFRPDWPLIWKVERDICFFYHDQAEWASIDGDWDYDRMYSLHYWDIAGADLTFMSSDEESFVRTGCLVMILAMAWDMIDRSGRYLARHFEQVEKIVASLHSTDEDERRLVQIVLTALQSAKNPPADKDELAKAATWVHRTYIARYFKRKAQETTDAHRRIDLSSY